MKPFAVFKAGQHDSGRFVRFTQAPKYPARFRVDIWIKQANGEKLENCITTKEKCHFIDLLEHTIKDSIDELLAETQDRIAFGFNCYLWS